MEGVYIVTSRTHYPIGCLTGICVCDVEMYTLRFFASCDIASIYAALGHVTYVLPASLQHLREVARRVSGPLKGGCGMMGKRGRVHSLNATSHTQHLLASG